MNTFEPGTSFEHTNPKSSLAATEGADPAVTHVDSGEPELSSGALDTPPERNIIKRRILGILIGLAVAVGFFFVLPADIGVWPRLTAATALLMAIWWVTEAVPIPITSLLPLIIFPILVPPAENKGAAVSVDTIGASYGNNIIFLFMGGFMLAMAMQRWNLHRRIALKVLSVMGSKTSTLIGGFMIATGFISMWVSNTATAVMMLPIGMSVLMLVSRVSANGEEIVEGQPLKTNFGTAMMLGIAYAASIGSLGTLIGTPPNALLAGIMSREYGLQIGFGQWMIVGVPISVIMMFIAWFLLTKVMFKPEIREVPGGAELLRAEYAKLGPISSGEKRVAIIFAIAALAWVSIPLISQYLLGMSSAFISDAGIAVLVGLALFLMPSGTVKGVRLLNWETAVKMPWDVLLLFGGGLALSSQFSASGLSTLLGQQVSGLADLPLIVIVLVVALAILFLTEITSNTSTAATFLPVATGIAVGIGVPPLMLAAPVALAATCAFMLPVATPPNAIAYSTGQITIGQMVKGGLWLNIIGALLITGVSMTLLVWVFGLGA